MRTALLEACGCFPTGRQLPGIAHLLRAVTRGLVEELAAEANMGRAADRAHRRRNEPARDASVDRVVEIGIAIARGGQIVDRKKLAREPGATDPQRIERRAQITDEDVKDAPPFAACRLRNCGRARGLRPRQRTTPRSTRASSGVKSLAQACPLSGSLPPCAKRSSGSTPLVWARELQTGREVPWPWGRWRHASASRSRTRTGQVTTRRPRCEYS